MRKCIRCNASMIENFNLEMPGARNIKITHQNVTRDLGKLKCAVCPECGYMETYVQEPIRFKVLT